MIFYFKHRYPCIILKSKNDRNAFILLFYNDIQPHYFKKLKNANTVMLLP